MNWNQTDHILVVWPAQGRVLYRQLDLNLINRHAASIGATLGLVTHDAEVRFYARQMGIPFFSNIHSAQEKPWSIRRTAQINPLWKSHQHNREDILNYHHPTTPSWTDDPIIRLICLGISVAALLILGVFILPSAKIILSPRVEIQSMRFDLSTDPSSTSTNLSTGHLPTYSKDVIVEGSATITATGSMIIPDDPALGNLIFNNISKQVINIPAGTIVSTQSSDPVRFITKNMSNVPIYPNESIEVPARAIKPGAYGNLPPQKLVVIEGDLGRKLTVNNPDPTQGGTDATFPTPTERDIQILHDRLLSQLKETALIELNSMLPHEDSLISPTLSMIETIEDTSIPSIGEPGAILELSMRLRYQSQVVSGEVLRSVVTPILNSHTPEGYSPIVNSLEISQLNYPSLGQDGFAHWTILVVRKLKVVIQAYQAIELVKGATVAKAKEYLSASLPLMEQAQIALTPTWWPRLPFLNLRIQVTQVNIP